MASEPKLFCFTVMRAEDSELALMREQLAHGAGIYACDDWAVLSDTKTWLTPGPPFQLDTLVIAANLSATGDGVSTKFKNAAQFLRGWEKLRETGNYKAQDFVVKVDPDSVFLPGRLRAQLKEACVSPHDPVFYANCQAKDHPHFMFGAIEVYSRAAIEAYFKHGHVCEEEFKSDEMWEERFMADCMHRLDVKMLVNFNLLREEHCNVGDEPMLPCVANSVAFHPFRTPSEYLTCWQEATDVDTKAKAKALAKQAAEEAKEQLEADTLRKSEDLEMKVTPPRSKEPEAGAAESHKAAQEAGKQSAKGGLDATQSHEERPAAVPAAPGIHAKEHLAADVPAPITTIQAEHRVRFKE